METINVLYELDKFYFFLNFFKEKDLFIRSYNLSVSIEARLGMIFICIYIFSGNFEHFPLILGHCR